MLYALTISRKEGDVQRIALELAIVANTKSHLFSRTIFKDIQIIFWFFLWGDCVQTTPQSPAPAGSLSSTRKSSYEVPERGFWGRTLPGEEWGGQGAKRKKGYTKKGEKWLFLVDSRTLCYTTPEA